jgi:hypothetical protein
MMTPAYSGAEPPDPPAMSPGPAPATETLYPLPKIVPGVVLPQWVRCGRAGCRCARGRPHGPYAYRFWREGGRLRKAYVRPVDLAAVRASCEARRRLRRELGAGWAAWRQLRDLLREVEPR